MLIRDIHVRRRENYYNILKDISRQSKSPTSLSPCLNAFLNRKSSSHRSRPFEKEMATEGHRDQFENVVRYELFEHLDECTLLKGVHRVMNKRLTRYRVHVVTEQDGRRFVVVMT